MNYENMNDIILHIIEGLNWDFIISCYGEEDNKLKYIVEKNVNNNGISVQSFEYITPTIEILQIELIELIHIVISKKYKTFYYGHWTIKQTAGKEANDNLGDSIEVMFSPCRFVVVEEKKVSKKGRKQENTVQHFKSAFNNRSKNPTKFNELLLNVSNIQVLEEMLDKCLDEKTEDYETASKIHAQLKSLKQINNLDEKQ